MFSNILIAFLPSFLQVPVRRLLGQKIGKHTRIRWGTILSSKSLQIGENVTIGPFCYIKSEQLCIGDNSVIKPLSCISTRIVNIGKYVHIAPLSIISSEFTENSKLDVGDHSRIFPFCWLDTGEGIFIGNNVGIGGHSLIFTHGVWTDYIEGGPVTYGKVVINDNVWLPWRVFIMPNVEIGKNSIVGANSLVNKSFSGNTLIGGSPAKVLRENILPTISDDEKYKRAIEILEGYAKYFEFKYHRKAKFENNILIIDTIQIGIDETTLSKGGLLILLNKEINTEETNLLVVNTISIVDYKNRTAKLLSKHFVLTDFVAYLRRYGIRLYIK